MHDGIAPEQLALFTDPSPRAGPPYVYAGWRNGLVKIGTSSDPTRRARELGITLLGVAPGGREAEGAVHSRFAVERLQYEWFVPSPRVWRWVTGLGR
jgi:hypothetical protein